MPVPVLNLKAQYASIKSEIDAAVADVFTNQSFILGPIVEGFENAVTAFRGLLQGENRGKMLVQVSEDPTRR